MATVAPCFDEELASVVRDAVAEIVVFVLAVSVWLSVRKRNAHSLAQEWEKSPASALATKRMRVTTAVVARIGEAGIDR